MITILSLKAELDKLTLLRGRTPQMTEVARKGSGAFDGAWERHPNGDELVQIVDGSATRATP
jgi:hypothetical protein